MMKVWLPAVHGGSGVDIHTRRLALALQRYGVGAEISWYSTYFQFAPFLLSYLSPPPGINIVHALSWSGFAFKRSGIPLIVTEQLDVLDPIYRPYKSLAQSVFHDVFVHSFMNKSFAAASAITAVSKATARSLAQTCGIRSAQVIPNFVDTQLFRPQHSVSKPSSPFRLLFVGNLTKRKGADLLAPIMEQLGSRFELRFTTGLRDGTVSNVPANMISIGKLNSDKELIAAYQNCDALLFPSRLEGLPIAPLEAMACAKPIIAACTSSLPEIVEDGVTGTLCKSDNIGQFVAACQRLAGTPEILRRFGEAARQRVEELFAETVVVPEYVALYERVLDARRS